MDIITIITLIGLLVSVVVMIFAIITFGVNRGKDVKEDTKKDAEIIVKLDNIISNINEIRLDQRTLTNRLNDIDKEVYRLKGDVETCFLRIDELKHSNERG